MSSILPFALRPDGNWRPHVQEIHAAVWDRVGLAKVQEYVREWASARVAQINANEAAKQEKCKLAQEVLENWSGPEDATAEERLYLLPDDLQEAMWQPDSPPLPLPPSHRPRSLAEKWAALAAVHDIFDFTGDKILPWPLPADNRDLVAFTEWMRGEGGAFRSLMQAASRLEAEEHASSVSRWLEDAVNETMGQSAPGTPAGEFSGDQRLPGDEGIGNGGTIIALPPPPAPSSLAELTAWIQQARNLLRGQEDCAFSESEAAIAVRKHFLEHLVNLFPNWTTLYRNYQPDRFHVVRELIAMMVDIGGAVESDPPRRRVVTGFAVERDRAPEPVAAPPSPPKDYRHSEDFSSVVWFGTEYSFTKTQAACIKVLWEAWENQTPDLKEETILEKAGSSGSRLRDVFEKGKHPAWGDMIVQVRKGVFRLQQPSKPSPTEDAPEKPQEYPA